MVFGNRMPTFCLSSDLFQGYKWNVPVDQVESLASVKKQVLHQLVKDLKALQLDRLVDRACNLHLCHHGYDLVDVLQCQDERRVWYLCDQCPCEEEKNTKRNKC